jgi:hypothetical protein
MSRITYCQGRPRKLDAAGIVLLIPSTVELLMTYHDGLLAEDLPDAVIAPAAMVRMSTASNQAVAV